MARRLRVGVASLMAFQGVIIAAPMISRGANRATFAFVVCPSEETGDA